MIEKEGCPFLNQVNDIVAKIPNGNPALIMSEICKARCKIKEIRIEALKAGCTDLKALDPDYSMGIFEL
jgi:hypothetical protein